MIKSIHSACVMVSNKAQAIDWYTKKLGMQRRPESEGHWVVMGMSSGGSLHLCETEFPGSALEPGNTGILLNVDDLKATVEQLRSTGVKIATDITVEPWGTYAMIADPDGNIFWLMQLPS